MWLHQLKYVYSRALAVVQVVRTILLAKVSIKKKSNHTLITVEQDGKNLIVDRVDY